MDNSLATQALNDHKWYGMSENVPLGEMTYRLFSLDYITTFEQFATTKYVASGVPASYLNLEYIHNNIHNWTGGFDAFIGHMTEVPVAGFDPIFWMHHW